MPRQVLSKTEYMRFLVIIIKGGVVVELFMFVFFWSLTAVYVRRANAEFDALTRENVKEVRTEYK